MASRERSSLGLSSLHLKPYVHASPLFEFQLIIACTQAFNSYLDSSSSSDAHLLSLARLLSPATVIRGAQLSIINRLAPEHHARIHTDGSAYAVARMVSLERGGRGEGKKVVGFFKVLGVLMTGIEGKVALNMCVLIQSMLE